MIRSKNILSIANYTCSFLLLAFIFSSCGKPLPILDDVDLQTWKLDKNGCMETRPSMQESIIAQRDKLLALKEMQIIDLLGKPDQNELAKRNEKFYYYLLEPAMECHLKNSTITPKRLSIRFNAMGLAKEVRVE